jgi:hypothetical protein
VRLHFGIPYDFKKKRQMNRIETDSRIEADTGMDTDLEKQ